MERHLMQAHDICHSACSQPDQHLTWNKHVSYITTKANKVKCFLQRNLKPCPTTVKTTCNKSLIRSILDYASTIWSPYTKKNIQAVESVQKGLPDLLPIIFHLTQVSPTYLQTLAGSHFQTEEMN